eukprot:TRINITY_DN10110_c0_g1_i1.p1 TRINITY_DN10110_c0_g1~~TRINITY_DN10110_c0_g1_i1.p1  ORF type:complete len:55 (-),score=2.77 TRINITY_DN10110_c0_g1_i1:213-377(-)
MFKKSRFPKYTNLQVMKSFVVPGIRLIRQPPPIQGSSNQKRLIAQRANWKGMAG